MKNSLENRLIWLNGEIVHLNEAKINVLTPTAQFGANVFEGIRAYWNEERQQLYIFRLDDHIKRLKNSVKMFKLEEKYNEDDMKNAILDVIRAEDYRENVAIRQTIFLDGMGSWSSKGPVGMFVAPIPKGMPSKEYNKKGLHCCVSSWRRISDQNISPRIKCGANYINSRMAQMEAWDNGYDCAIFMNEQGKIAEGPGSCLFMVRAGKLITPSLSSSVLESITRDTVIEMAREMGIEVIEREIERTELYMCDEAFLCGSAMEITPVYSIDKYEINGGKQGEMTELLHKRYLDIVTNREPWKTNWLTPVYEMER